MLLGVPANGQSYISASSVLASGVPAVFRAFFSKTLRSCSRHFRFDTTMAYSLSFLSSSKFLIVQGFGTAGSLTAFVGRVGVSSSTDS